MVVEVAVVAVVFVKVVVVVFVSVVVPVYVIVVDVDVDVVVVAVCVVDIAVVDVIVVAVAVVIDVVVSMQLCSRCDGDGWCWPGGQVGHVLCVVSEGMYRVSRGQGLCVSHLYALAVGLFAPPQIPPLYSVLPVHCVFAHRLHV